MTLHARAFFILLFTITAASMQNRASAAVTVTTDSLRIDGNNIDFIFGAEVQYFRARGGSGRNVPRQTVEALWNKLFDRVLEAKMNFVSLYIPWDFHEPQEGVFDFDGTLDQDQDHDGNPDYPSRDIKSFLALAQSRGIKNIMVRPGPYINAEWGPEGFGAIPHWLLDHYPEDLTGSRTPQRARTVSFGNTHFRSLAARWMETLYKNVLKEFIGPGKPVQFLQIDNESNYFWDSIYERDLSPTGIKRYQTYLQLAYRDIQTLNAVYAGQFSDFAQVLPPKGPSDRSLTSRWHYDWYEFHDVDLLDYYHFIRSTWERVGLKEPTVLFTSCDSFNAAEYGLLPRLDFRQGHRLSLTTMNVYPKTYGTAAESVMNTPMKAAHDAALIASSHAQYYQGASDWVMSSETMGGWFPPVEVTLSARQHTYGSLMAAGIKAITIYYFHEGWNWTGKEHGDSELHFDAPLDKDMNPTPSFGILKTLGTTLQQGLATALVPSKEVKAPILIAHSSTTQYRTPDSGDAILTNSNDSAALYGYFREAGAIPTVAFIDAMKAGDLDMYKLVVWQDVGYLSASLQTLLSAYADRGGTVLVVDQKNSHLKLVTKHPERIVHLSENPAKGWNDDSYTRLKGTPARLNIIKEFLHTLGIQAAMNVTTADGKPFVHATLRDGTQQSLLFLENFLPESRMTRIQFTQSDRLHGGQKFQFKKILSGSHPSSSDQILTIDSQDLVSQGITLPTTADAVDLWEIKPL